MNARFLSRQEATTPTPQLIGPVPESTPAGADAPRRRRYVLPHDLLNEASRRLGIMLLLGAVLWVVATGLGHFAFRAMYPEDTSWTRFQTTDAIAIVCALVSLALFLYNRRGDRHPGFVLDLGLVYMVFTCLGLSLLMHLDPLPEGFTVFPMITWAGAVILMFSAIVPNTPAKTLIAGLIAASMNPLGTLIAVARGLHGWSPASNALLMHYPDYILVGVAVVISRVVTKLGQQVTKAREMGSYRLVTLLGTGGMGEVWRARHRMLARDAAIKLIRPDTLDRGSAKYAVLVRRRFEQEARATASLRSPNTVELYDFGVTEDGVFYYVMELLDGIDLETLVKRFGPQPPARVVWIMRQVCRSLAEAHRQGMIHRDIKPKNILLCRLGNEYDFVKVLDFGLVKVLGEEGIGLTGEGVTPGTPAYMAPEVAVGSQDLDGRADLYSLGCVAYWLITGNVVFDEHGVAATMLAHVQKAPARPSQRTELEVPESLDRAIMMCLAKQPADRPARAEILARILENCENLNSWTAEDAESWWQANIPEGNVHIDNGAQPKGDRE